MVINLVGKIQTDGEGNRPEGETAGSEEVVHLGLRENVETVEEDLFYCAAAVAAEYSNEYPEDHRGSGVVPIRRG